jgi:hypothetical protein
MITDPYNINYNWYASMGIFEQQQQFKQHYNVTPYQFAKNELSLQDRCSEHDIEYTPPQPNDSVATTEARHKVMKRAIKNALQKLRRAAMNDDERFRAYDQDVIRRRKRHLNEDVEQRRQRLEHEAATKSSRREQNFKVECDKERVKYKPPQNNKYESIKAKKKRRELIRKQFKNTPTKESQSTTSQRTKRKPYNCYGTPCDCNQPPAKSTFSVMGRDYDTMGTPMDTGTKFASSLVSSAMYCKMDPIKEKSYWSAIYKDPISIHMDPIKETCYWSRYKEPYIQHEFSLRLDNTTYKCPVDDVLFTEVWINDELCTFVTESTNTRATINEDSAVIKHYMNPQPYGGYNRWGWKVWGWEEKIMLEVVCTGLPSDIIEDAKNLVVEWEDVKGWDGEHLYNLMSETTTSIKVEFRSITFEEFTIRKGYPTYSVAIEDDHEEKDEFHLEREKLDDERTIEAEEKLGRDMSYEDEIKLLNQENEMSIKELPYGPNWRKTWEQIESEKKKKEEEERKRKYWYCRHGIRRCHLRFECCSSLCKRTHFYKVQVSCKKLFPKCIDGHEICHDGIRQCPSCKYANIALNQGRFKCYGCEEHVSSLTGRQFEEHLLRSPSCLTMIREDDDEFFETKF